MAVAVLQRGVEGKPRLARQRVALLKEMLRLGADPNIASADGTTPLRLALDKEYSVDVFRLLLKHGADPDRPGKDGRTVRDVASRKRDQRYARALARS
jgi:ankyrin repeat protein